MRTRWTVSALMILWLLTGAELGPARAADPNGLPPIPLSLDEVLVWVDRAHPLLKGSGTEKIVARGRLLRALGAFEPQLVNGYELVVVDERGPDEERRLQ